MEPRVIGTTDSGAEEPVIHGENGLLVPQGDVSATSAAIDKLFSSPEESNRLGQGGRRRAEQLTWDSTVKSLLRIYEQVLDGRGS